MSPPMQRHSCGESERRTIRRRVACWTHRNVSAFTASRDARRAYLSLLRVVTADQGSRVATRPTGAQLASATADERARRILADELAPAASGPRALVLCVRRLAVEGRLEDGEALTSAARRMPGLYEASHAAGVVLALARGQLSGAADHLRGVSRAAALDLVPAELADVELALNLRGLPGQAEGRGWLSATWDTGGGNGHHGPAPQVLEQCGVDPGTRRRCRRWPRDVSAHDAHGATGRALSAVKEAAKA
jgi:hypothetical protein